MELKAPLWPHRHTSLVGVLLPTHCSCTLQVRHARSSGWALHRDAQSGAMLRPAWQFHVVGNFGPSSQLHCRSRNELYVYVEAHSSPIHVLTRHPQVLDALHTHTHLQGCGVLSFAATLENHKTSLMISRGTCEAKSPP